MAPRVADDESSRLNAGSLAPRAGDRLLAISALTHGPLTDPDRAMPAGLNLSLQRSDRGPAAPLIGDRQYGISVPVLNVADQFRDPLARVGQRLFAQGGNAAFAEQGCTCSGSADAWECRLRLRRESHTSPVRERRQTAGRPGRNRFAAGRHWRRLGRREQRFVRATIGDNSFGMQASDLPAADNGQANSRDRRAALLNHALNPAIKASRECKDSGEEVCNP